MTELHRHIGEDTDVPAGDIGVGSREVSYMFGQYKRLENRFVGALTGKGLSFGGSQVRTEATGYGAAYFMENMLNSTNDGIKGKTAVVSGSGNVALYCMQKIDQLGGKAVTASDSSGFIYDPDGIRGEKWEFLRELKEERRGRVQEYAKKFGCEFHPNGRPWVVPCDIAFPCATENELVGEDAKTLLIHGCRAISEGANMPSTAEAVAAFHNAKILFAPGKASNAGGVGVSGLEQSQNAQRIAWSAEEVDRRLQEMMKGIHEQCVEYGAEQGGFVNYVDGANIAGFVKVADAMLAYGIV
jgi:glutamate dehydrogenase (NADP+)